MENWKKPKRVAVKVASSKINPAGGVDWIEHKGEPVVVIPPKAAITITKKQGG